jgi:hypothetical protein
VFGKLNVLTEQEESSVTVTTAAAVEQQGHLYFESIHSYSLLHLSLSHPSETSLILGLSGNFLPGWHIVGICLKNQINAGSTRETKNTTKLRVPGKINFIFTH